MRLPTRRARTGAERAAAVSSARAAAEAEAQAAQEVMAQEHASRVASLEVSRAKTEGQRAAHELAAPLQADYLQAAKLQAELEAARVREEAAAAKHRSELARDASMHKASGLDATRPDDGGAHEAAFGRVRLAHEQALATERQRSVEAERKLEAVVAEQRAAYEATGSQLRWLSDHGKEEATRLWCEGEERIPRGGGVGREGEPRAEAGAVAGPARGGESGAESGALGGGGGPVGEPKPFRSGAVETSSRAWHRATVCEC